MWTLGPPRPPPGFIVPDGCRELATGFLLLLKHAHWHIGLRGHHPCPIRATQGAHCIASASRPPSGRGFGYPPAADPAHADPWDRSLVTWHGLWHHSFVTRCAAPGGCRNHSVSRRMGAFTLPVNHLTLLEGRDPRARAHGVHCGGSISCSKSANRTHHGGSPRGRPRRGRRGRH